MKLPNQFRWDYFCFNCFFIYFFFATRATAVRCWQGCHGWAEPIAAPAEFFTRGGHAHPTIVSLDSMCKNFQGCFEGCLSEARAIVYVAGSRFRNFSRRFACVWRRATIGVLQHFQAKQWLWLMRLPYCGIFKLIGATMIGIALFG